MFTPQHLHADAADAASQPQPRKLLRRDGRIIIHFDYDCFYAACFEVERPELRSLPLAVQQKQIIVTCNYEARKRGLYKLQLITEAKRICPEVIIVLGEDLTRFRNHSKALYSFLKGHIWSGRAERLGFDEVWLDVTDMIDYNASLLGPSQLHSAWFCLNKEDPTQGFSYDATKPVGGLYPKDGATCGVGSSLDSHDLALRLVLGSHLAFYLRDKLEEEKRFTSTVGVSTNKVLSKLVGNVHKPKAQTTLMPPYGIEVLVGQSHPVSNVQRFLDDHEVGKIPGIGHKGAQQLRELAKGHQVPYHDTLVTHYSKEQVTVRNIRLLQGIGPELLETTLGGPGAPRGIGGKIWDLLHGIDDTEVSQGRDIPRQISIEDTYLHLHDLKAVRQQLIQLSASLIKRLRIDLTADDHEDPTDKAEIPDHERSGPSASRQADRHTCEDKYSDYEHGTYASTLDPATTALKASRASPPARRWLAHPRTIRLSTRERKPQRSFARISRSSAMPAFIFNLATPLDTLATKLAIEILLPMFMKLIPSRSGFDVNLVNVAATNMQETAGEGNTAVGRDIAKMFVNQEKHLRNSPWRVEDKDVPPDYVNKIISGGRTSSHADDEYSRRTSPVNGVVDEAEAEEIIAAQHKTAQSPEDPAGSLARVATDESSTLTPPAHGAGPQWQGPRSASPAQAQLGPESYRGATDTFHSDGGGDDSVPPHAAAVFGSEDAITLSQNSSIDAGAMDVDEWDDYDYGGEEMMSHGKACAICGALMPAFAMEAHMRFHEDPD